MSKEHCPVCQSPKMEYVNGFARVIPNAQGTDAVIQKQARFRCGDCGHVWVIAERYASRADFLRVHPPEA